MSRVDSHSAVSSAALSRRAVLPALAAAPTALAAATGQAFSSPNPGSDWGRDRRLAEVDRLIRRVNETCLAQHEASDQDNHDELSDEWCDAEEALADYAAGIAAIPEKTEADALVLAKVADFFLVNDGPDIDGLDLYPCIPAAVRTALQARGIAPTEETARTVERDELRAEIASRAPEPPVRREPPGLNTGNWIIRIRDRGLALKATATRECSLEDGTPEWLEASVETERREAELVALRDEFIAGRNNYDVKNPDRRFHFNGVEEFAIQYEFITAFRSSFWTDQAHSDLGPLLRDMQQAGESWAEHFFEQAQRWNASRGGANV